MYLSDEELCKRAYRLLNIKLSNMIGKEYSAENIQIDKDYMTYYRKGVPGFTKEGPATYLCKIYNKKTGEWSCVEGELAERIYRKWVSWIEWLRKYYYMNEPEVDK